LASDLIEINLTNESYEIMKGFEIDFTAAGGRDAGKNAPFGKYSASGVLIDGISMFLIVSLHRPASVQA
jgi:hypothetical protein